MYTCVSYRSIGYAIRRTCQLRGIGGYGSLIDRYVQEQIREGQIPGWHWQLSQDGETAYLKGYGVAEGSRPVTPSTPFYICSVGKPLRHWLSGSLRGRGKLRYDAPVTDYIPWFTLADPVVARQITIANLISHTSGLSTAEGGALDL